MDLPVQLVVVLVEAFDLRALLERDLAAAERRHLGARRKRCRGEAEKHEREDSTHAVVETRQALESAKNTTSDTLAHRPEEKNGSGDDDVAIEPARLLQRVSGIRLDDERHAPRRGDLGN